MAKLLTSPGSNPKTRKSLAADGTLTWILHLAPAKSAGVGNVCPNASLGCLAVCLNLAGRGGIVKAGERTNPIQEARKRKTREFASDRDGFLAKLRREIRNAIRLAEKEGYSASFRLNGTSDLEWETLGIMQEFPGIQFYDYTKSADRYSAFLAGNFPPNYHLTFSRSEDNEQEAISFLAAGGTASVVFTDALPETYRGFPVHNADASDYRPNDLPGWQGLVFKGTNARKRAAEESGFAVKSAS